MKSDLLFFCLGLLSIRVVDPMSDSPIVYRGGGDSLLSMYVTLLYIIDTLEIGAYFINRGQRPRDVVLGLAVGSRSG